MDPSAILCRYTNSFDNRGDTPIVLHTYTTKDQDPDTSVKTKVLLSGTQLFKLKSNRKDYCDLSLLEKVKKSKNMNPILSDPFRDISVDPFLNPDGITLANIDMVFNFSNHTSGYIIKQESTKDYNFVAIGDGPGGFSQYVMYRNPSSYGYGSTPSDQPFNEERLDMTHFNIIEGPSGKGDIRMEYKHFIQSVRTVEAIGVDLVVGNYTNDRNIDGIGYLLRLLIALSTIKIGGTFISKIRLDSDLMIDLLYITTQCFDKVTLFKPLSTDTNDEVYYVVAKNGKINNIEWVSYLEESYSNSVKKDRTILRLLDNIPDSFIQWITEYNNLILLYKDYLSEVEQVGVTKLYDTYKCKAIWNLPQI